MIATGSTSWDTGIALRVEDSAKFVFARMIVDTRHLYIGNINVYDTLTTWSHIVLSFDDKGN